MDLQIIKEYNLKSELSNIYHKGQDGIWDGKVLLSELENRYGKPNFSEGELKALIEILSLIIAGEYAAWQISSSLTFELNDFGAKMAATSQTHDEARHFYTMCDYVKNILKVDLSKIHFDSRIYSGLDTVTNANSLSKKLLGMQLMVEPVAISIFYELQKNKIEPILSELLKYYIRDEARHITLGVKYLPKELQNLSLIQRTQLLFWQAKLLKTEIDGLFFLKNSFETIGINSLDLFSQAEERQIAVAKEMAQEISLKLPIDSIIKNVSKNYFNFKTSIDILKRNF